jgi:hypothetical protein
MQFQGIAYDQNGDIHVVVQRTYTQELKTDTEQHANENL